MNSPLAILFFTVMLDLVGFGIVLPVLPLYARSLGASDVVIGVVAASFSLMTFMFSPLLGRWSDRVGRKVVLSVCILINALGYALFAHATTLVLLILSRMLCGIGASNISVAQAYIADVSDPSNRARSLGLIGAAFGLGFIIGPALGGLLKLHIGIEAVGYVPCALSILNALLAWIRLPEPPRHHELSSGIKRHSLPTVLQHPLQGKLIMLMFAFTFAFVMMQITFALLANERFGWREDAIGGLFALIGIVAASIQGGAIGPAVRRFGEKQLLKTGLLVFAGGITALPWMPNSALVIGLSAAMAAGSAFINPSMASLLSAAATETEQGLVLGLSQSAGSLARIIGPIVGTWLYGIRHELPYALGGIITLCCVLVLVQPLPATVER